MKQLKYLCLIVLALVFVRSAQAQVSLSSIIHTDYVDIYRVGYTDSVEVERQIKLTNQTAELYVSEYQLQFSSAERINNLMVLEDDVPANFTSSKNDNNLSLRIKFEHPAIGKASVKLLTIKYTLNDYLIRSGGSSELFIPVAVASKSERLQSYQVQVVTPAGYPAMGISKPRAQTLNAQTYVWDALNRQEKALYISFSDRAYYQVQLHYLVENKAVYPRSTTIALVPDGIYQKMYLDELSPRPESLSIDQDGNYLATYTVGANSIQKILFRGYVELMATPREEVRQYWQQKLNQSTLKRYLATEGYWQLKEPVSQSPAIASLDGTRAIFDFVVDRLSYDRNRLNGSLERMGASAIYLDPSRAVCMEYTDLFIALARYRGIPSREVVGYALTNDQTLLPASFLGDVLHAWPEHYDRARGTWLPTDPTWTDTSGIDYYSSLDLSHISFVYHGTDQLNPLPPGVYKTNPQSKDILVQGMDAPPKEIRKLTLVSPSQLKIRDGQIKQLPVEVKSESNYWLYQQHLLVKNGQGEVIAQTVLPLIAPGQTSKVDLLPKQSLTTNKQQLTVEVENQPIGRLTVVRETWWQHIWRSYRALLAAVGLLIIVFWLVKWHF